MEPRRWKSQVPSRPVKRKEKSAVAASLMNRQPAEDHERGNEQNAAHADRADQKPDEDGDGGEQYGGNQSGPVHAMGTYNRPYFFQPILSLEAIELVFLHEHGVLLARIDTRRGLRRDNRVSPFSMIGTRSQ